ncbi:MAG: hypothetical protein IRZ16_15620 [Myxococcaceae bacterium]|nr:hypothetical protein [Myxococcaceae bacterium]
MKQILAWIVGAAVLAPSFGHAQGAAWRGDAPRRMRLVQSADDEGVAASTTRSPAFPPHRYTYVASGVFLVGAIGLSWWANGQANRAESIASAREARRELQEARETAAGANLLYALAGVTLAYGVVLEFLPDDVADKADLTFHF